MKTQILQGINLENDITTIKITLGEKPNKKLIEEIKNFHPIFLKKYHINNNTLIIQSKLPNLWKEIAKVLGTKEEKRLSLEVIKKQIKSMSTISVLDVVDKLDEEITPFILGDELFTKLGDSKFNRQYTIGCGANSAITLSFSTNADSQLAKQIQTDKYLTNKILDRLNIPTAPWETIKSENHLKEIFKKYKKPVVIKPTAFTGGRGVHTGIKTQEEATKAFRNIMEETKTIPGNNERNKIIIQEEIQGEDYRLLVINGKLEAATKRVPAFIEGDGEKTIKELIEEMNKDPRRNLYKPTHILKPIVIDKPLVNYLAEQGLNLKHIPKKGDKIFVRKVASMSQGGTTIDFTDKINAQIKYLAEATSQSLRAYVLGIDVICKNISKPLTKENGGIIEVNTMPEAYLNMYPVSGPERGEIGKKFVEGLLVRNTTKIVAIGGQLEDIEKLTKNLKGPSGLYSNNKTYINGEVMGKKLNTDKAIQALKINAYLENIIFHYKNIEEIKKYGFGFDKIDILYINKSLKERKFLMERINKVDKKLIKKISIF